MRNTATTGGSEQAKAMKGCPWIRLLVFCSVLWGDGRKVRGAEIGRVTRGRKQGLRKGVGRGLAIAQKTRPSAARIKAKPKEEVDDAGTSG